MPDPLASPSFALPHPLEAADGDRIRLSQLTDCHILADAQDRLKGVNTRATFEAVCRDLVEHHPGLDLVLATGDLSQDESIASYDYLAQGLEALRYPVFWLPGNHDDPVLMRERLAAKNIFAAKQVLIGNWVIVLLDSTVAGETGGQLADVELDFLDQALSAQAEHHALVCLHHHPIPSGSDWMDQLGLAQPQQFIDRVSAHANLRGVLWGHVHQEAHHRIDGTDWMSTPSTCVQFKPGCREFTLDELTPGYRRLDLLPDGRIDTKVWRVNVEKLET